MGSKSHLTGEIAVILNMERAVKERWSVRKVAEVSQVSYNTALDVLNNFVAQCKLSAEAGLTLEPAGLWPILHKRAKRDRMLVETMEQNDQRTASQDRELTNAVLRLAAIAGAARGRIPEAETNGFSDDASDG